MTQVVMWCWRHGGLVVALALALMLPAGWLAATRLSLDTDETHMIAAHLPYRQAEQRFDRAFPHTMDWLVAVVEAATPEQAEMAAATLVQRLDGSDLFWTVERPAAELFFQRNGLLFLPEPQLEDLADRLIRAQPLLGGLAADPSLRGMLGAVSLMLLGVERGDMALADLNPALTALNGVGQSVLAGRPQPLSWQGLVTGREPEEPERRRFVITRPRLDYSRITPGDRASRAIRTAAAGLDAKVRLTGPVALTDDNFRSVAEGMGLTALVSLALVSALLLLALGSLRMSTAVLLTLGFGLVLCAGFAAVAVGVLNPISVAFVVLFMGLAVDFAIQFTIRFRHDLFRDGTADGAMAHCAKAITRPLLVVAAAIATGFLAFLPTDYVGVSQLGLIAGVGMVIGVAATLTVLPALLGLLRPPPDRLAPGFAPLAPVESLLRRHAGRVVVLVCGLAVAALAVAPRLAFDFDPLHLQNPKAEAVATFLDLARSPESSPYVLNALTASPAEAGQLAARLGGGPVAYALSLDSFIPDHQAVKLAIIADLGQLLGQSLHPAFPQAPPSLAETRAAMAETARRLDTAGATPLAATLRSVLERGRIESFERATITGLSPLLTALRQSLAVSEITMATLPPEVRRDWIGAGGEGRVEIHPRGDLAAPGAMADFVAAVRAMTPDVSGSPMAIVESGRVVMGAFLQAGLYALFAMLLLLGLVLRRWGETALVLAPLALGGLFTLAAMVALGMAVNFANIIAFPLLLGIGVAYNVYFVLNWRAGMGPLLPSSTARAVLFSALTTGVAFGALALSPHRGTASLGLVLMLSLALMVLTSFVVLPAAFALIERRRGREPRI